MSAYASASLAAALLASLIMMGASRKLFSAATVERRLVPHRADIGIGAFGTIGVAACVALGLLPAELAPGGSKHLLAAGAAQVCYVASLVARKDLPPAHPHRLLLLVLVWLALAMGGAASHVLVEAASLWIVKLRLGPTVAPATDEEAATSAAPFIKTKRAAKSPAKKTGNKGRTKKK